MWPRQQDKQSRFIWQRRVDTYVRSCVFPSMRVCVYTHLCV